MCFQYMGGGGVSWVHWGISWVDRGDIMSRSGGYISWCMWGISWVHQGNTMNTLGGYYEYIGDIMMHVGEQVGKNLPISVENPNVLNIPWCTHDIPSMYAWYPQCTEHPPMYSWYPHMYLDIPLMYSWYPLGCIEQSPDALMISPTGIMISPTGIMISPDVLNTPWCTQEIPSMYLTHIIQGDHEREHKCWIFAHVILACWLKIWIYFILHISISRWASI